ncbi:MAG: polymerase sigma factor, sigma-70 family [Planctomycetaceae bacterium]|nr:polymerase sigma factor, sigma-70 family [Planctomycetaceae bacterium]
MEDLIFKAQAGDLSARDELLIQVRSRLRQWAELALNSSYTARIDASDLTQITMVDIHQRLDQFVGKTSGEFEAWLRTSLQHNIVDCIRNATAQRRSVMREQSIDAANHRDGQPVSASLGSDISTPSMRAIRSEDADRLRQALDQLTPDQRTVVKLVHLEGSSIAIAAERLGKNVGATAKLLQRGIAALRKRLEEMGV